MCVGVGRELDGGFQVPTLLCTTFQFSAWINDISLNWVDCPLMTSGRFEISVVLG